MWKVEPSAPATPLEEPRNSLCVVMWMGRGSTDMAGMAFVRAPLYFEQVLVTFAHIAPKLIAFI